MSVIPDLLRLRISSSTALPIGSPEESVSKISHVARAPYLLDSCNLGFYALLGLLLVFGTKPDESCFFTANNERDTA